MIEFSPDGSAFVLADLAGGLSLHDGKTGAPRKTLRSPLKPAAPQTSSGYHFQMAFQPGGKAFAVTELHGDIALYDTKSGVLRSTLRPAGASELLSVDVEFGKKSNILASVSGLNGDLWDTDTGQHIVSLPGLRAAYWSPDGGLIAWQKGDDEVVITDGRTGEIRQTLRLKGVSYYRWSPDSRYLVATQGETILLLRASDGAQLRLVLLGPADQPTLLAASGDGSRTLDGLAISCLGERAPGSPPPLADPGLLRDFLADKPQASRP
jgi:dipeptidyl aminopeptidase/acylaminoacyl peptidase